MAPEGQIWPPDNTLGMLARMLADPSDPNWSHTRDLVRRYADRLSWGCAVRRVDPDDVTQRVMEKLLRPGTLDHFGHRQAQPTPQRDLRRSFRCWLRIVTKREWISEWRELMGPRPRIQRADGDKSEEPAVRADLQRHTADSMIGNAGGEELEIRVESRLESGLEIEEVVDPGGSVPDLVESKWLLETVLAFLDEFVGRGGRDGQRAQQLLLRSLEEMSYKEIAQRFNCTNWKQVRDALHDLRTQLRRRCDGEEAPPPSSPEEHR